MKYETYSATDDVIVFFWRVLESFSHKEKAMFVKFIWGHSRLPDPAKGRKFTIQVSVRGEREREKEKREMRKRKRRSNSVVSFRMF